MTNTDLPPSTHLRAAAWVPDDVEDRPWEDAIACAAEWIWKRSQEEDPALLLVSNTQDVNFIECNGPDTHANYGAKVESVMRDDGHRKPRHARSN